jgi:hypothetical protein
LDRGRPHRAFLRLLIAVAAILAIPVGAARATIAPVANCQPSTVTEPFSTFGDTTPYELVPGGDFPGSLGGWAVLDGASLTSSGGNYLLSLPPRATATSPMACVNVIHPTVRFYAETSTPGASIEVSAVLGTHAGAVAIPLGDVVPGADLAPSRQLLVRVPLFSAVDGGVLVGLRFEARGGTARIDDVYVDPWRSG